MTRYGLTDDRIGGEVGVDIGTQWSGNVAVGASSAPNFLPARSARVGLVRRFDHGWLLGARLQHREYADDSVDTVGLLAERYVRNYRFAYALDRAQLASEQALVHSLAANVYTDAGAQYGIVLAAGEEIETVAPGQLLRTDIRSIAVTGRHPVGTDLGIGWSVGTQQQGALYRRSSVGVRIYGDF
jgi:YaiO family outer membrane protein